MGAVMTESSAIRTRKVRPPAELEALPVEASRITEIASIGTGTSLPWDWIFRFPSSRAERIPRTTSPFASRTTSSVRFSSTPGAAALPRVIAETCFSAIAMAPTADEFH